MKIKYSSLKNIYIYLLAVFIVMKVWRAFSGDTERGGLWNYIQIFYVVIGPFLFLKYSKIISKEPAVLMLVFYSAFAFIISVVSIEKLSISSVFNLIKVPFAGMVIILFYTYRLRTENMHSCDNLLKAVFYISSVILCYKLGFHMLGGGRRSSEIGAVADVYYVLGMLPYIITITDKKRWLIPIVVAAVSIFISQKRAGFIALSGLIFILYFVSSLRDKDIQSSIKKNLILIFLIVAGYFLMVYMDSLFNLRLFVRLEKLETDGGSGRSVRWQYILEIMKYSSAMEILFGHGFDQVRILVGHAHNDFLEVLYNFGIVSVVPYFAYYVIQVSNARKMIKEKYSHYAEFSASLFISICLAMFSFYVIDATYIICGCFTQGVLLADWRMSRNLLSVETKDVEKMV